MSTWGVLHFIPEEYWLLQWDVSLTHLMCSEKWKKILMWIMNSRSEYKISVNASAEMFTLMWLIVANVNRCVWMPAVWRVICSGNIENNLLMLNVYCSNAIDKHKKLQFREQSRKFCITHFINVLKQASHFYKGNQTPCKLLFVRRQNAQWTFSEFLFGLSFKWKFASQWCAEVQQNGILDWINPPVADRQKYPLILCERLMSEPVTGGRAVICSVIYKWCQPCLAVNWLCRVLP